MEPSIINIPFPPTLLTFCIPIFLVLHPDLPQRLCTPQSAKKTSTILSCTSCTRHRRLDPLQNFRSPLPRVGLPQTEFTINAGFGISNGPLDGAPRFAMSFLDSELIYLFAERVVTCDSGSPAFFMNCSHSFTQFQFFGV